jgi:hypothetical protein
MESASAVREDHSVYRTGKEISMTRRAVLRIRAPQNPLLRKRFGNDKQQKTSNVKHIMTCSWRSANRTEWNSETAGPISVNGAGGRGNTKTSKQGIEGREDIEMLDVTDGLNRNSVGAGLRVDAALPPE